MYLVRVPRKVVNPRRETRVRGNISKSAEALNLDHAGGTMYSEPGDELIGARLHPDFSRIFSNISLDL
jgi:hypothetical protein